MLRFFDSAAQEHISRVADADRLTVFVGAGASMEVGLPSWEGLIKHLLDDLIRDRRWEAHSEYLHERVQEAGVLAAAEVIEAALGTGLAPSVRRHLYPRYSPSQIQPGPLAASVAALQAAFGQAMQIGTTNYDTLAETALRNHPDGWWSRVRSYVSERVPPAGTVGVTHLHGVLGERDMGSIVLTEGDYARMRTSAWQERWMLRALEETTCVFLGASLSDANLVRYLHSARSERRGHLVIWRRPPPTEDDEMAARDTWERAERARWERLGLTALYADNYADIAQFVHEVAARRSLGAAYEPFSDRLRGWLRTAEADGVLYAQPDLYEEVQGLLHEGVRQILSTAQTSLRQARSETLACALWSLYPPPAAQEDTPRRLAGQERAIVLATSDRVMTTPATLEPLPVDPLSRWAGIQALCHGSSLGVPVNSYASRWRYVYALPVFRESPRLPLGALTVSTTTPEDSTVLRGMASGVRAEIDAWLAEEALGILTLGEATAEP